MARVLLVMPRMPQRMGTPYLGQLYVGSALMAAGHEVRAIDVSAPYWEGGDDEAVAQAERFGPDLIGMTLFTYGAARGYRLAQRLAGVGRLLAAGGPHPTVYPREPLAHGFDVSIVGEAEGAIVQLADTLDGKGRINDVVGAHWADGSGPAGGVLAELDALPRPGDAYEAFDMSWYSPTATVVPGGLMTSRGCPARCTFCANYVTGRAYRWRSTRDVIDEMVDLRQQHGIMNFPFWDDAFTARRPRLNELCEAILAERALADITWTCITPGNMVRPVDLATMRRAGCVAINFGIESGDYNVLKAIQKGQRPEHVKAAVAAAKAEGMVTIVNFMFGFPQEDVAALDHTLDLMRELSDDTDYLNHRGVLVPFPGTAIYNKWVGTYGFANWWLDLDKVPLEPDIRDPAELARAQRVDPTLELNFFDYSDAVREKIAECVRFKAMHNERTIARLTGQPIPQDDAPAEVGVRDNI